MKNKIFLNNNARNHTQVYPLAKGIEIPEEEGEQILWAENVYSKLVECENLIIHWKCSNRKKGYMIAVYEMEGLFYITVCIKNEFGTYNNMIYINSSENDSVVIGKFLRSHINEIMKDYKKQIYEAKEDYIKRTLSIEEENEK